MRMLLALLLTAAPAPAPSKGAGAAAQKDGAPAAAVDRPLLDFLNQAIAWNREGQALVPDQPSEVVFSDTARQLGRQGLSLAFDYARGASTLGGGEQAARTGTSPDAQVAEADARVKSLQGEIDGLNRKLDSATGRARTALQDQLDETKSELQLAQLRAQAVKALADFAGRAGGSGGIGQIDELQRSVPELQANTPAQPAKAVTDGHRPPTAGLVALTSQLIDIRRELSELRNASLATGRLAAEVDKRRTPLLADLRATLQHGDQLATEADSADPATLPQRAHDIDELTAHFKKVTGALLPLGKLAIVLQSAKTNFDQWRDVVDGSDGVIFRSLMLRVLLLGIAVAAILGASAFWRRATFRYVRDPRRRQQSLLVRRIVVGLALCLMIGFSLVTEVGSIATFAGFITAGLAVALQNVILSVAAYFSLIGRYGVRVGDRVQIGGVTGDVMDIGLVRLHVMEVGPDGQQTGRVTAFSNSVLFQPASGFFKQVPGSNFTWHQVRLTLSPKTDYRYAEDRLRTAIARVFAGYKERIVRDHQEMSQNVTIPMGEPGPQSTLRLTDTGLEMTIRYPVPLDSAAAVDDQVTRALLDAVESEPRLRLAGSGTATIQPSPEPAHA